MCGLALCALYICLYIYVQYALGWICKDSYSNWPLQWLLSKQGYVFSVIPLSWRDVFKEGRSSNPWLCK